MLIKCRWPTAGVAIFDAGTAGDGLAATEMLPAAATAAAAAGDVIDYGQRQSVLQRAHNTLHCTQRLYRGELSRLHTVQKPPARRFLHFQHAWHADLLSYEGLLFWHKFPAPNETATRNWCEKAAAGSLFGTRFSANFNFRIVCHRLHVTVTDRVAWAVMRWTLPASIVYRLAPTPTLAHTRR